MTLYYTLYMLVHN